METTPQSATTSPFNLPTKDHTPYIELIVKAADWIHEHHNHPRKISDPLADFIIYIAFRLSDTKTWCAKFDQAMKACQSFHPDAETYWPTIAAGLSTPIVINFFRQTFPTLPYQKYLHLPIQTPEPTPPPRRSDPAPIRKILNHLNLPRQSTPHPSPTSKQKPTAHKYQSITEFIIDKAPSVRFLQIYYLAKRYTKNKHSSRGRNVYPYGQDYIAQSLNISLATVNRAFRWFRQHRIFFKRSTENHKEHKCASWFICTTWKQSAYFFDHQYRRPKTGSPRSRSKRKKAKKHTKRNPR